MVPAPVAIRVPGRLTFTMVRRQRGRCARDDATGVGRGRLRRAASSRWRWPCCGAGALAPAAGAAGRPARRARATLPADQVAAGPGVPRRRCARAATARWLIGLVVGAGARADPARRPAGRAGRPAVRRPLGGPGGARRPRRGARRRAASRCRSRRGGTPSLVRYGLSTQGWGGWAVDLLKGYAVGAVIGVRGAARLLRDHPASRRAGGGPGRGRRGRRWWCCSRSCCRCWSSRSSTSSRRWPRVRCAPS